jgi:hypothetical protein
VPDGFDVAVRWAACLTEPLLSTAARIAADDAMRARAREDPDWAVAVFGGALADVLTTLPPDDPWRHLSARIGGLVIGTPPRGEPGTGAWRRDRAGGWHRFGTWRDTADLAEPVLTEPFDARSDPGVAALADPLRPEAAAVLAFAARGRAESRSAVDAAGTDGLSVVETGADALRWAVHRRRAYQGPGDLWPVEVMTLWAARAEDPRSVAPPVPERELIPAGAYRELVGDGAIG